MSSRKREYEIAQTILLGGQISQKYPQFKEYAKLDADTAEALALLDALERDLTIKEMLQIYGEIEFLRNCMEITKLSMILGDTRGKYNLSEI